MKTLDRLLLNRHVQRLGGVQVLAGIGLFVWGAVKGQNPLIVLGIVLMALTLVVSFWPRIKERREGSRASDSRPVAMDGPTRPLTYGDLKAIRVPMDSSGKQTSHFQEILDAKREAKKRIVEAELVRLIDEWKLVRGDDYAGTDFGTFSLWQEKTATFISKTLGDAERQRFESNREETAPSLERQADLRILALERLRDKPETWRVGLGKDEIRQAIEDRRCLTAQDQIVLAGTPALSRLRVDPGVSSLEEHIPRLLFGRAEIPKEATAMQEVKLPFNRLGRIIRVPVINERGAAPASSVHAVLKLMPDDEEGSFSPRHPAQAEWIVDDGSLTTRIDLPGNGQAHVFNVALVVNDGYPCIFEWTRRSREAKLHGYGIWSTAVEIAIEVCGSGSTPVLTDTLKIDATGGSIRADWASKGIDEATNSVAKQGRQWPAR